MSSNVAGRVVCYSVLSPPRRSRREQIISQLLTSVGSLREHNRTVRVVVFWLGSRHQETEDRLRSLEAQVVHLGSYEDLLHPFPGGDVLVRYPVLHKYFVLDAVLEDLGTSQLLLIDCDTVFLDDVDKLFERHADVDLAACAEVGTVRRERGYDPAYLDEEHLARLAQSLGGRFVEPINSGILLLSRKGIEELAKLRPALLEITLRLMVGLAKSAEESDFAPLVQLRERLASGAPEVKGVAPLGFPSSNHWIVEEVALWLALGLTESLTMRDLPPSDAALGGEVYRRPRSASSWIIGHYFSVDTAPAMSWCRTGQPPHASPKGRSRAADELPIDPALAASPLLVEHEGFALYEDLFGLDVLSEMTREAREAYWGGQEQSLTARFGGVGRDSHPPRRLVSAGGGDVQDAAYCSPSLKAFLESLCGLEVEPTGRRGSVNYYTRSGDFMGLHLDVVQCELVVLTVLQDLSPADDPSGSWELFPGQVGRPLPSVSTGRRDRRSIKAMPGQSLVMFGGLVPHRVRPVAAGQRRIVSALCFRAGQTALEPPTVPQD
ncbi:hypothetical protein ACIO3S_08320 [Nocardioides sp. NPDC087217]|uniref:hypothetical protein n=1 Tax=Nocardioides sp. NPDC087217 TaxID=3364335 RepID=UPI0037F28A4C